MDRFSTKSFPKVDDETLIACWKRLNYHTLSRVEMEWPDWFTKAYTTDMQWNIWHTIPPRPAVKKEENNVNAPPEQPAENKE